MLRTLEEFRHLLAFAQRDVRLLPIGSAAGEAALPLDLAVRDARANAVDFRAEQLLDRAPDLHLVRVRRDLKDDRPPVLALNRGLLCNQRPSNDVGELHFSLSRGAPPPLDDAAGASASCSFSKAALVATTRDASATWRAVRRPLCTSSTPGMLRTERDSLSSAATSTSTAFPVTPRRASISAASFVLISLAASSSTTTSAPC